MKKLVIIGAGGCGRDVAWLIERINEKSNDEKWNLLGFIDSNSKLRGQVIDGYKVLGDYDYLTLQDRELWVICAVANPRFRRNTIDFLERSGFRKFPILLDPSVIISDKSILEEGCIIFANSIVSVDCIIKKHTIVGLGSTIGHDSIINKYVSIYPGVHISGNVNIGECSEVGSGATILQGTAVGEQVVIGMSASVIEDVDDCYTVVGNPAKRVFRHKYWEVSK